ncbi:hypothetical protein [Limnobacter sp.]|uniref:hypothetical protein n=1 Tax=Limnobacter sp. TaxID=2003368 RepID=UPI0027374F1F|nr:hypothetical protein [Limnobacter sp.]MDP3187488.1 hypothetical protein [Limnobacter sp.]
MSIKRFAIFFVVWVLSCAFFLEPALVAPLFETNATIDLAFNGNPSQLGGVSTVQNGSAAVESMDHFRVLCLLYFGLPVAIYLATQWKEL